MINNGESQMFKMNININFKEKFHYCLSNKKQELLSDNKSIT